LSSTWTIPTSSMSRNEKRNRRQPGSEPTQPVAQPAAPQAGSSAAPEPGKREHEHPFDTLGTIVCIFVVTLTIGFVCLRIFPTHFVGQGTNPTHDRSLFTSVNAVTMTGFQQSWAALLEFTPAGKCMLAGLMLIGALTSFVGGGWMLGRAIGFKIRLLHLFVMGLGVVALVFPLLLAGLMSGSSIDSAFLDAVSLITGGGLQTDLLLGDRTGWLFLVAFPLSFVVALGPVLWVAAFKLFTGKLDNAIARHLLAWTFGSVAVGMLVMVGLTALQSDSHHLAASAAAGFNARSSGFPIHPVSELPASAQWWSMLLTFIGLAPGATGAGLTLLPISLLAAAAWEIRRGRPVPKIAGVAIVWVALQFLLVLGSMLALLPSQSQLPADRLLLIVLGAVSNVGISHDPLSITGAGAYTLATIMLFGRLLPIAMLCWMAAVVEREQPQVG
jgi:hypothetical protein